VKEGMRRHKVEGSTSPAQDCEHATLCGRRAAAPAEGLVSQGPYADRQAGKPNEHPMAMVAGEGVRQCQCQCEGMPAGCWRGACD